MGIFGVHDFLASPVLQRSFNKGSIPGKQIVQGEGEECRIPPWVDTWSSEHFSLEDEHLSSILLHCHWVRDHCSKVI